MAKCFLASYVKSQKGFVADIIHHSPLGGFSQCPELAPSYAKRSVDLVQILVVLSVLLALLGNIRPPFVFCPSQHFEMLTSS